MNMPRTETDMPGKETIFWCNKDAGTKIKYAGSTPPKICREPISPRSPQSPWNLGFRFLFFPDLIKGDLKVTHPSLERLESDSSKSRET